MEFRRTSGSQFDVWNNQAMAFDEFGIDFDFANVAESTTQSILRWSNGDFRFSLLNEG
jgi:hypothetical protein